MKTIQTLLLITAAVLMTLAVADDVAALPAQEGAVRLYEIRQGGTDIEVEDEHSLIYIYKEQDGILTEITEVFAPGMRRWELRYRYDRHGNCLGAHHYYSHRVDADAPWQHEERELGAEDELELSYSPEKAELVHERGCNALMRVKRYCRGMDELRKADAPDYAINAWETIILGSPAELDDLLTAHPELLQWTYGKCKTRDGSSFSRDLLSLAIAEGDTRLMDVVLRHGVSPNRLWPRPADGELCSTISLTPLAEVVRQHGGGFPETEEKAYDLLNFLIARGADVDKPVSDGSTPLHLAAGLYCEGIVSFHLFTVLKALGAKDDVLNAHEETPLDVLNANLRLNGIILQDKEN